MRGGRWDRSLAERLPRAGTSSSSRTVRTQTVAGSASTAAVLAFRASRQWRTPPSGGPPTVCPTMDLALLLVPVSRPSSPSPLLPPPLGLMFALVGRRWSAGPQHGLSPAVRLHPLSPFA